MLSVLLTPKVSLLKDHAVTPTAVRLALHDDPNRFPSAVTVSYYDSTAAQWTLCKHRAPLLGDLASLNQS